MISGRAAGYPLRVANTGHRAAAGQPGAGDGGVAVIAPSPVLTITVEPGDAVKPVPGGDEIHLHAGGQGFWVARMIARLGVPAVLCCSLGGETGTALRALAEREQVRLHAVPHGYRQRRVRA